MRAPMILTALFLSLSSAAADGLAQAVPVAGNAWQIELADVTGDGSDELVYATYDGRVCAQRIDTNEVLWEYQTGSFPYDLAAADVTDDGRAEAFCASADGKLYAISADGALLWTHETVAPLYQVAVAHMDGGARVLTGGVTRDLICLAPDGRVQARVPHERVVRLIEAGDTDADGEDEVVMVSHLGDRWVYEGPDLQQSYFDNTMRPVSDGVEAARGIWRPYWMSLEDMDADGATEMLLGSGFYNANGIRAYDNDGALLWDRPAGFTFRDGTHYSHTELVGMDVLPAPGKEIVAINARRLFLLDGEGNELAVAAALPSFTDIEAQPGTPPVVWLASSPNGEDRVYRVTMSEGWVEDVEGLQWEGRMAEVTANLDRIYRQVLAYEGEAPDRGEQYMHFVSGGQPETPDKIRAHFGVIDFYRKQFPYDNQRFAMSINMMEPETVPGFTDRYAGNPRAVPGEELPKLLAETCEADGIPFVAGIGHSSTPWITLQTAEAILEACPNTLVAFATYEDEQDVETLAHYLEDFWIPLMDLCRQYGKQAIMVEKAAWWITTPAVERFKPIFDGGYADVMVPSVEDSNSRSPELNLSGRVALYMSGGAQRWVARTISDELCWNRYFEWEFPQSGHPFLRRQLSQAALGASLFRWNIPTHTYPPELQFAAKSPEDMILHPFGEETIGIIGHLLGKGLLVPPKPDELLNVSPRVIAMEEPAPEFYAEAHNGHGHREFAWSDAQAASPLEGVACHWGMAPTREHYIGSYLMGQQRHYGNFVPSAPWGFPLIAPEYALGQGLVPRECDWRTDGVVFHHDGEALTGAEAREEVLADFASAAETLPFRLEGDAFMQANRLGEGRVRIILIDPGFLDPADRDVTLHVPDEVATLVDLLSGEPIGLENGSARLIVPAGAFRLLEARTATADGD